MIQFPMRWHLIICLLAIQAFAIKLSAQQVRRAEVKPAGPNMVEIMDPQTFYSFRGTDGKGFLNRSPVNLPQPLYSGSETGIVALIFRIDALGKVSDVHKEASPLKTATREMEDAAIKAVENWTFAPLPASQSQAANNQVRVVIQFNHPESGVLYSEDGLYIIEGLSNRLPVKLIAPQHRTQHEGVVVATITLAPSGKVKIIHNYHGASEQEKVIPRLGIITYEALSQWQFDALAASEIQIDQEISVTIRYLRQGE